MITNIDRASRKSKAIGNVRQSVRLSLLSVGQFVSALSFEPTGL